MLARMSATLNILSLPRYYREYPSAANDTVVNKPAFLSAVWKYISNPFSVLTILYTVLIYFIVAPVVDWLSANHFEII